MLWQVNRVVARSKDNSIRPIAHTLSQAKFYWYKTAQASIHHRLSHALFRDGKINLPPSYGIHSLPRPSPSSHFIITAIKIGCLSSPISTCFYPFEKCLPSGHQTWKHSLSCSHENSEDHWFRYKQKID